ncbi:DeoR family transcriptional regulator [Saccharopolyspora mangrovi]|uniref:DeoR family transcriptional regulator n=1 Tax=Saccharopolyspora mangrovi TaxID=3082379 RepID=A0ABU6AEB1_9PSEU|nr:DeoR family transcriptional regulator [Saccharopolyspora sp. S2-29]MEB3369813.1 DeoR family transcriptional regulator [Saccharopolyspora sp. S2-29]
MARSIDPLSRNARQRQDAIRERLAATGVVRVHELADSFGVSAMTIHRDLDALQFPGVAAQDPRGVRRRWCPRCSTEA